MRSITALVLEQALAQCSTWRHSGRHLAVSVNISATNLLDHGFADLVRRLLEKHDLPADALVLELTETSIICEFERSRLVIEELRSLGLVVSIDDFGAGFTSLAYLSNLAVGELKLDRTFIASLATRQSGRDFELVRSTIDLGHALGLRVVAEGIEDGETLDLLSAIGAIWPRDTSSADRRRPRISPSVPTRPRPRPPPSAGKTPRRRAPSSTVSGNDRLSPSRLTGQSPRPRRPWRPLAPPAGPTLPDTVLTGIRPRPAPFRHQAH